MAVLILILSYFADIPEPEVSEDFKARLAIIADSDFNSRRSSVLITRDNLRAAGLIEAENQVAAVGDFLPLSIRGMNLTNLFCFACRYFPDQLM